VAETPARRLLWCRIDALVKRWNKCVNVDGGYVEKCSLSLSLFLRFECRTFYVLACSRLRLGVPCGLFLSGFPTQTVLAFSSSRPCVLRAMAISSFLTWSF
jgi:hypothetical protein